MGILSGLDGMGLGGFDGLDLFEAPEKPAEEDKKEEEPKAPEINEADYIFEKSYTCPVCNSAIKAMSVRAGKSRLVGTDIDLRPKYENIEPAKYDVVVCDKCGCAALTRFWGNLTPTQKKNFIEKIGKSYKAKIYKPGAYSYKQALERYQLALANALVKGAKDSEKAYICLKAAWLIRSDIENLPAEEKDSISELTALEEEYLSNALEGFISARSKEMAPICGMDETTLDYLIAALMVRFKKYEQASKLIGNLLVSRSANPRIKEKALTLKEKMKEERE